MISNRQKARIADALRELHQSMNSTQNYREFPRHLLSIVNTLFPVDWMGIYTFGQSENAFNIVTNPGLPFDWNEKYGEVMPYDGFRIKTFTLPVGSTCIFSQEDFLTSDESAYCYEVVKKYTDTSQFLALHTFKTNTADSGIAFYRTDDHFKFSEEDRETIDYLSPFLVSLSQTIMLYTESDLKRVTMETFCKSRKTSYLCLDSTLTPIDIPRETRILLKRFFTRGGWKTIPDEISLWIKNVVTPTGKLIPGTGPWKTRWFVDEIELVITAHEITTEYRETVLVLFLKPHGSRQDFRILAEDGLSPKEVETLSYLPLGYSNTQIAQAMAIAEVTVKKHLKNAARKLEAYGRTETLFNAMNRKFFLESMAGYR